MCDNQEKLDELKKKFLKELKLISEEEPLSEYFQYLSNSIDSNERFKLDQKKLNRLKTNEKQLEYQNKQFKTNWNLDYCEYCKLDFWPSNCQVYMVPKCRITSQNAKLYNKFKLFNYKPKYKSYKDKLLKKLLSKGIDLVYKCKRCMSKNIILHETKRDCSFKPIKLNQNLFDKNLKLKAKTSKTIHTVSFNKTMNSVSDEISVNARRTSFGGKKKFQSLQLKLKQNEIEQERLKSQKQRSLTDFLMQMT
jgi:hypothetical protein